MKNITKDNIRDEEISLNYKYLDSIYLHSHALKHIFWISTTVILMLCLSYYFTDQLSNYRGVGSEIKDSILCNGIFPFFGIFFILAFGITLIWAIHLYINLRTRCKLEELDFQLFDKKEEDEDDPFTFYSLAESHKEWAQVWFTSSLAIFIGGVIYSTFNLAVHMCPGIPEKHKYVTEGKNKVEAAEFTDFLIDMMNYIIPNAFVYSIFIIIWLWAAKHYKSHWHNFVVNAHRHRSLYRLEQLRKDIKKKLIEGTTDERTIFIANKAIIDLYRQSGLLLLIQEDSSYLENSSRPEDIPRKLMEFEEVLKSAAFNKNH